MKVRPSRFEINKEIRHVLARHGVDPSLITFQTYGYEVSLQGILWHNDNSDFNGAQVEALIQDFNNTLPGYEIRGDTENWVFNNQSLQRLRGVLDEGELPTIDEQVIAVGDGTHGEEES